MSQEDPALGFVGLGAMGGPIAGHLLARQGSLAVFDIRAEAMRHLAEVGATTCGSPAEIPAVVDGLLDGAMLRTVVDLSTTGPAVAAQIRATLSQRGVGYLDAP